MQNERKTEELVRNILREKNYYGNDNIIIEEQRSYNKRIDKLLENASKTGKGRKGYPEFIISFKDKIDDLIIIECKAKLSEHESKDGKSPYKYAVDGVLHYAKFLKDDFNVTAIAVSGETEKDLKISSYLWLKNNYVPRSIQDKYFFTAEELNTLIKSSKPLDELDFISKSNEYNELLNSYSIPEVERCTLISSILIALQDRVFLESYKYFESSQNKELIKSILDACERILKNNKLDDNKTKIVLSEYKKFENNITFNSSEIYNKRLKSSEKNTILKDLIHNIERDILPYMSNNEFDTLGKFYRFFIKYAGSDQKTGLVLTPDHITEFFCDVARLTENDIVFDPCCGTGGFLVASMNYMIKKVGLNSNKTTDIKTHQLIGVEKRSDMFTHACSNMMMRGDGKSHIVFGDCFDEKIKKEIKAFKPTKTFLNPPYDVDADGQLEFIENALECICHGGLGIAICQMSTVVGDNKKILSVKERLLNKHTLKAVFSMPSDLFYPVGVVTAILIFEAHIPHSKTEKTFFGYFKEDGFIKVKNKGRMDTKSLWNNIKEKWLKAYFNKENITGLSINKEITSKDEWCAEAYIETDYSTLTEKDFENTIKKYLSFYIMNGSIDEKN